MLISGKFSLEFLRVLCCSPCLSVSVVGFADPPPRKSAGKKPIFSKLLTAFGFRKFKTMAPHAGSLHA
jgi:hypothetical protein